MQRKEVETITITWVCPRCATTNHVTEPKDGYEGHACDYCGRFIPHFIVEEMDKERLSIPPEIDVLASIREQYEVDKGLPDDIGFELNPFCFGIEVSPESVKEDALERGISFSTEEAEDWILDNWKAIEESMSSAGQETIIALLEQGTYAEPR